MLNYHDISLEKIGYENYLSFYNSIIAFVIIILFIIILVKPKLMSILNKK